MILATGDRHIDHKQCYCFLNFAIWLGSQQYLQRQKNIKVTTETDECLYMSSKTDGQTRTFNLLYKETFTS